MRQGASHLVLQLIWPVAVTVKQRTEQYTDKHTQLLTLPEFALAV